MEKINTDYKRRIWKLRQNISICANRDWAPLSATFLLPPSLPAPPLKKREKKNGLSFTYCIVLVRLALPQVADHSLQSLHSHCTVWHVHVLFLCSFSGGCVQVCGRPEQSGCCTTIWVVWIDRVLSANPHVADQSVHGFQVHLTLLQGP